MAKLTKYIGGTVCGNPGGPEGTIPRLPLPVTKPRDDSFAKLPSGSSLCVEVRKKLTRNSLTAEGPRVLVLLITICCARVGVTAGKPGTLAEGRAVYAGESSKWEYPDPAPPLALLKSTRSPILSSRTLFFWASFE